MRMKKKITSGLLLLVFAAAVSIPLAGCKSAGDAPGGPTGPPTAYSPDMDYSRAGLSARADRNRVPPGETFTILATFWDAESRPIEGGPVYVYPEAGQRSAPYFSYATNPTITNAAGKVSILVYVDPTTPPGSYTLVAATGPFEPSNQPYAKDYVHITVPDLGLGVVASVEIAAAASPVTVGQTADFTITVLISADCDPADVVLQWQYNGAGTGSGGYVNAPGTLVSTPPTSSAGVVTAQAAAHCGNPAYAVQSDFATVTVNAPAP